MPTSPTHSFSTHVRLFLSLCVASALGVGLACDSEDGPCDNMCDQGAFGNVDEFSDNGTLTCECSRKSPSQNACEAYCEEVGGSADNATVDGKRCTCTGLE